MKHEKCTIVDVAKAAGVSIATVSRVINDNYQVNIETKKRVQKVIDEMQFVPNIQAREIKIRKSKTIGVIVPSVDNMYFTEVINGIQRQLLKSNYTLLLSFSKNNKEEEQKCIENLLARNVAGIVIADASTTNVENGFFNNYKHNTPIVLINGNPSQCNLSFVLSDEEQGIHDALQHLWEKKHQLVLFIRGSNSYSYDVKEKIYLDYFKKRGIDATKYIIEVGEGNSNEVVERTSNIMCDVLATSICTAAFCCNDLMALGTMDACKKVHRNVPHDFSVIGFDNVMICKYCSPKLTSVDQHMKQLGKNAAQLVLENIGNEKVINKKIMLNTNLVKRESVGINKR